MTEFEGQVLAELRVLKNQMEQLMGIGQPGRLHELERRLGRNEQGVQRMKGFVAAIALLPGLIQGLEALYGAQSGAQKREAAVHMVGSAIHVADAMADKSIVDPDKFTAALGMIVDGVVACLNANIWAGKQA